MPRSEHAAASAEANVGTELTVVAARLTVDLSVRQGWVVALLSGEADLSTVRVFDEIATAAGGRPVVLDLTDVSFLDSVTLNALIRLQRVCSAVRVVAPISSRAAALFKLTGLCELFEIFQTAEDALRSPLENGPVSHREPKNR